MTYAASRKYYLIMSYTLIRSPVLSSSVNYSFDRPRTICKGSEAGRHTLADRNWPTNRKLPIRVVLDKNNFKFLEHVSTIFSRYLPPFVWMSVCVSILGVFLELLCSDGEKNSKFNNQTRGCNTNILILHKVEVKYWNNMKIHKQEQIKYII